MPIVLVLDIAQRSPAWYAARLGRLTGSVASDVLATIKSGEAAARRDLRLRLVCERLTGVPQEDAYLNAAMLRGIECEPLAITAYEALAGAIVTPVGFLQHETLMAGCSPDGLVGTEGILEVKCPKSATHLRYLRQGGVPSEHVAQITHNLWVSGAEWCDFLSWDDRFPDGLHIFLIRLRRADVDIMAYEQKALAFLAEVDKEVEAVLCLTANTSRRD